MLAERRKTEPNRRYGPQQRSRSLGDRYNLVGAHVHPHGIGDMPQSQNADTTLVAINDRRVDSRTGRTHRWFAAVNRRVDILELERSHDRISSEAYNAGRLCQAIWEKARGPSSGGQWMEGSRVDAEVAKEIAIIRAIDNARTIQAHIDAMRRILGELDERIVSQVLRDRMTYRELATIRGRSTSEQNVWHLAQRFREGLDVLAVARADGRYAKYFRDALEELQRKLEK